MEKDGMAMAENHDTRGEAREMGKRSEREAAESIRESLLAKSEPTWA